MKLTIDLDALLARLQARRTREAALRARGVAIFREWVKQFAARRKRIR
jgi:hypothetical protein